MSHQTQKERTEEEPGKLNSVGHQRVKPHLAAISAQFEVYAKTTNAIRKYLSGGRDFEGQPNEWKEMRFGFVSMTPCYKLSNDKLVPAEYSVVVFSFDGGVLEVISGFLDSGEIPLGARVEAHINCEVNGFPYPGKCKGKVKPVNPHQFMDLIVSLAQKYGLFFEEELLLFTCRVDVPVIHCCLNWITHKTGYEKSPFHIVSFEVLLKEMSHRVENPNATLGVIQHECGATRFLYQERYDYLVGLTCKWHGLNDASKINFCCQSIALRRVYNALYYLCHLSGKPVSPTTHSPYSNF